MLLEPDARYEVCQVSTEHLSSAVTYSIVDDLSCDLATADFVVESDILSKYASQVRFSHSSCCCLSRIRPDRTKQCHGEPDGKTNPKSCRAQLLVKRNRRSCECLQDERAPIHRVQKTILYRFERLRSTRSSE